MHQLPNIAALQRQSPLAGLETRILLCHVLGLTRVQLITASEQIPNAAQQQALQAALQRRLDGEPIAYIVGQREFFGLMLRVNQDVLIPRPDTELLVELALERLPAEGRLLDMGTGSGAIAIAIAHSRSDAMVTASDYSDAALQVAAINAARHLTPATRLTLLRSDWYASVGQRRFDVIVANPPYIEVNDIHLRQGDLRFEPLDALTDHGDGLSALRTIVAGAHAHLRDGWLLMEHGYDQAAAVRACLHAQHFQAVQSWRDSAGIERVSGGRLTP